jgi:hypothetical protein
MSSQGVVSRKKASHTPGLHRVKGQKFCLVTETRSQCELPSLSLGEEVGIASFSSFPSWLHSHSVRRPPVGGSTITLRHTALSRTPLGE